MHSYRQTLSPPSSPLFLHSLLQSLKSWWIRHPVLPGSKFAIFWDLLVMVVIVVICLIYSYQVLRLHCQDIVDFVGHILPCSSDSCLLAYSSTSDLEGDPPSLSPSLLPTSLLKKLAHMLTVATGWMHQMDVQM